MFSALRDFLKWGAAGGIVLIIASLIAIILANSGLAEAYDHFLHLKISVAVGDSSFSKGVLHWVNDGLMALFFLLVGLEIKREFISGELSQPSKALLPILAAIGGMAAPALIYFAINQDNPETMSGWAIPAATDIAFALGILSILGKRVPLSLKVFLTAVAIIDDLGAIVIIALFYSGELQMAPLAYAGGCMALLGLMNYFNVARVRWYIIVGIALWFFVFNSGLHATLAGVLTAMFIPLQLQHPDHVNRVQPQSPLVWLEHKLHPWIAFLILPIFGFCNAGVSLEGLSFQAFLSPVPLGIAAGLVIGKQIGVFGVVWASIKLLKLPKPAKSTWTQLYGVALLCGIGFTMSLFIGSLAFTDPQYATQIRLGVLTGSIISALMGALVLRYCKPKHLG